MKNCKRVALLVVIFILSAVLNVYADDYATSAQVTLTPSATQIGAGGTVTVALSAKCETGIEGIDATLEYDKTKLELSSETAASGFTSMSGEDSVSGEYQLSVLYTDTTDAPTEANFATLTFKVLDAVTVDETLSVKLTGIEVGDSDDEWFTVEDKEITLTVIENVPAEDGEGDDNQTPTLSGIKVASDAIKVSYKAGEKFDKSGLIIVAEYTDGTSKEITNYTYSPVGELSVDDKVITITYTEGEVTKTTTQAITVEAVKDTTTAPNPINNAGLTEFTAVAVVGIVIVTIVLYAKYKKYRDIK